MAKLERIEPGYFRVVRSKSEKDNLNRLREKILAPHAYGLALPRSNRPADARHNALIKKDE